MWLIPKRVRLKLWPVAKTFQVLGKSLCLRNTMYVVCALHYTYMVQRKTAKLAHSPLQMNRDKHIFSM